MIEIKYKKDCTGCHACSNICHQSCIAMEVDSEGFYYPAVDYDKCVRCGLCIKVCPICNKVTVQNNPKAYACINKDLFIRIKSSSGGLFTLIAERVIDDGGIVFGAGFDDKLNLSHSYVDRKEELDKFRGSKYVQSRIGDTYKQVEMFLKQEKKVLFTGTPCQIGGLKSFLGKAYSNLICIDIICHGVPSPKVWKKYLNYQEGIRNASISKVSFRNKVKGWKHYSLSFSFNDNTELVQPLEKDLYLQAFLKDISLRPSCYACEFKNLHRESDITLADFWGIENVLPSMDDDLGVSLILVNSDSGRYMFKQIADNILYYEVDINQAIIYNTAAIKSSKYNPMRDNFFKDIDNISFDRLVRKYCVEKVIVRVLNKIKLMVRIILRKVGLLDIVKKYLVINR